MNLIIGTYLWSLPLRMLWISPSSQLSLGIVCSALMIHYSVANACLISFPLILKDCVVCWRLLMNEQENDNYLLNEQRPAMKYIIINSVKLIITVISFPQLPPVLPQLNQ